MAPAPPGNTLCSLQKILCQRFCPPLCQFCASLSSYLAKCDNNTNSGLPCILFPFWQGSLCCASHEASSIKIYSPMETHVRPWPCLTHRAGTNSIFMGPRGDGWPWLDGGFAHLSQHRVRMLHRSWPLLPTDLCLGFNTAEESWMCQTA